MAGLDGCGISRPHNGVRTSNRPACSELLHRLNYPGPLLEHYERDILNGHILCEERLKINVMRAFV